MDLFPWISSPSIISSKRLEMYLGFHLDGFSIIISLLYNLLLLLRIQYSRLFSIHNWISRQKEMANYNYLWKTSFYIKQN